MMRTPYIPLVGELLAIQSAACRIFDAYLRHTEAVIASREAIDDRKQLNYLVYLLAIHDVGGFFSMFNDYLQATDRTRCCAMGKALVVAESVLLEAQASGVRRGAAA